MKSITVNTNQELNSIYYLSKCYDFALSLQISLALSELDTAIIFIREQPFFKHEIKKLINQTIKESDFKRYQIKNIMKSKDFFDSYSDKVIDLAAKDIKAYKNAIVKVLSNRGVDNAELYAQLEVARSLLQACALDFKNIGNECFAKYKVNLSSKFSEYDLTKVYASFDRAVDILFNRMTGTGHGLIDFNTKTIDAMWNKIHKKIAQGKYIGRCMKAANKDCPDFLENKIEVREMEEAG